MAGSPSDISFFTLNAFSRLILDRRVPSLQSREEKKIGFYIADGSVWGILKPQPRLVVEGRVNQIGSGDPTAKLVEKSALLVGRLPSDGARHKRITVHQGTRLVIDNSQENVNSPGKGEDRKSHSSLSDTLSKSGIAWKARTEYPLFWLRTRRPSIVRFKIIFTWSSRGEHASDESLLPK